MTGWLTKLRSSGSVAGILLIGLGAFLLYENAVGTIASITGHGALKFLPALLLSAARLQQLCGDADRWRFLECVAQRALVETWPALLVIAGSVLTRIP